MQDAGTTSTLRGWSRRAVLASAVALAVAGAVPGTGGRLGRASADTKALTASALPTRAEIVANFGHKKPKHFGMFLRHMVTHGEHRTALTFDACGGPKGSHYDEKLINTLRKHHTPATLFLNARWIASFPTVAAELAADPLFELGNHGLRHRPLTVRGQAAYGIAGTASAGEAYDEIMQGLDALAELTGSRTVWFRPGTAWADDVGVAIARALRVRVVSFSINADEGATASKNAIAKNLGTARSKSISLGHFNHPEGKTAEGLAKALPRLLDEGRKFVTLTHALG